MPMIMHPMPVNYEFYKMPSYPVSYNNNLCNQPQGLYSVPSSNTGAVYVSAPASPTVAAASAPSKPPILNFSIDAILGSGCATETSIKASHSPSISCNSASLDNLYLPKITTAHQFPYHNHPYLQTSNLPYLHTSNLGVPNTVCSDATAGLGSTSPKPRFSPGITPPNYPVPARMTVSKPTAYHNFSQHLHPVPVTPQMDQQSSQINGSAFRECPKNFGTIVVSCGKGKIIKRTRTIFSSYQMERLEEEFANSPYMVGQARVEFAESLNLTPGQVKIWFQNRRIKSRKHNMPNKKNKRTRRRPLLQDFSLDSSPPGRTL